MKRALITGSRGFVGRHLAHFMRENGWNVMGLDTQNGSDCLDYFASSRAQYDLVVHAAARGPYRKAIDTDPSIFSYNVMLDAAAIDWAIRSRQGHFTYLSSSAVYDDNLTRGTFGPQPFVERKIGFNAFDNYGETKRLGEKMIQASGLHHTIVRPFSGYGTDQSTDFPFGAFIQRARDRDDPFIIWGDADQVRDFIHIDDIVRAIVHLYDEGVKGPVNLCTGIGTSMRQLAQLCIDQVGYESYISVDPDAPLGVRYRVGDPKYLHYFYEPKITIEEGVRRAFEKR